MSLRLLKILFKFFRVKFKRKDAMFLFEVVFRIEGDYLLRSVVGDRSWKGIRLV